MGYRSLYRQTPLFLRKLHIYVGKIALCIHNYFCCCRCCSFTLKFAIKPCSHGDISLTENNDVHVADISIRKLTLKSPDEDKLFVLTLLIPSEDNSVRDE